MTVPPDVGWSLTHVRGSARVRFGRYVATCSCNWRGLKERHGPTRNWLLGIDHSLHLNEVSRERRAARQAVQA